MPDRSRHEEQESKRRYWKGHIGLWRESGLSQAEYCRQNQLNLYQMHYWVRQFPADEEREIVFARIGVAAEFRSPSPVGGFRVTTPNGYAVEIPESFNASQFKALLHTLQVL